MKVRLDRVSMRYPNGHVALDGIQIEVPEGRLTAVIGGSGCGKSTLLRLVAGLEHPTEGTVRVGDRPVTGPSTDVGVVFQEPRLMPWLTVAANVAFGIGHLPAGEAQKLTEATLERVGLAGFAGALPKQLSGGMAQRAALARALVTSPEVLLLDEPFSALDALTRADLQQHLLDLWEADRQTVLLVTHDIDEALRLADEIVVLCGQPGRIADVVAVAEQRPRDLGAPGLVQTRHRVLSALSRAPSSVTESDASLRAASSDPPDW